MKISTQFMKRILGFLGILLLLAPLTVLAQTKVVVIPLGNDMKPLKNIITVAKANGNFTDPVVAVNSISDASATNPYLVVIGPGVYTITQTLVMKAYVDIVGSGENVTKLTGAISTGAWDASSAMISGTNNSILSSLTVENTGGSTLYVALYNNNASPTVSNVTLKASGGTTNLGVFNVSSSPTMTGVTATASGGTNILCIYNVDSSPTITDVSVTASGGANTHGVYNYSSSPTMTDVTIKASGGTTSCAVGNYSSSSPTMINVIATASGGATSNIGVNNASSSPRMTGVTATASGGINNTGVANDNSSVTMTNVTATASGGTNSFGVYNSSSSSPIRRSTMAGGSNGLYTDELSSAKVSQSTLIGGVGGAATKTCVACDNGSGTALDANCQPPPP